MEIIKDLTVANTELHTASCLSSSSPGTHPQRLPHSSISEISNPTNFFIFEGNPPVRDLLLETRKQGVFGVLCICEHSNRTCRYFPDRHLHIPAVRALKKPNINGSRAKSNLIQL